jgi:hypothetical protein
MMYRICIFAEVRSLQKIGLQIANLKERLRPQISKTQIAPFTNGLLS